MDPAIERLLARFDLAPSHPDACHAEAAAHLAAPGLDDPALRDLEALPFVTIDNDDSRDLDQALYVEAHADGAHTVYYALADAAYYVRPGSALFDEALARGASYYLPGLVVPMLPRSLSEGLISLNEGALRRALTFIVALDARGEVRAVELVRARIRSRAKLSYRRVQALWDGAAELADRPYTDSLMALRTVGRQRVALAEAEGVVHYQRVEVDIVQDHDDRFVAFEARRDETDRANEQISLLVNVEGARLLAAHAAAEPALQAIFRVHPAPRPEDLTALARLTSTLAERHAEPRLAWRRGDESLARWLERVASLPDAHRPVVLALQRQALLLNQRSSFAAEPGRHYGVGAPCYARFSSPMREIVGIFTHKEALELLHLERAAHAADDDALREAVIRAANRAKETQRQLTKAANQLVIADLLGPDLDLAEARRPRRAGNVVGLTHDKAFVVLDQPPIELKVYAQDLGGALGLELGQRVRLVTRAYDASRDRFALAVE